MKKDFDQICICLDESIQDAEGKLQLQTKIGTFIYLEKQLNENYKITFNTDKGTYESITKENLYKFLFENWRGNHSLGRDDSRLSLFEAIKEFIQTNCRGIDKAKERFKMLNNTNQPLNQILFGPPGTGKTYNTINKAIEIVENRVLNEEEKRDRKALKDKFEEYKKAGQIEFVTFHQSYGYEEFVEGIKAKTTDKGIEYQIEDGIFKKLSDKAIKNFKQSINDRGVKKDFDVIFKERILDKLIDDEKL